MESVSKYPSTCFILLSLDMNANVFFLCYYRFLLLSSSVPMLSASWFIVTELESFLENWSWLNDLTFISIGRMRWCSCFPFLVCWRFLFLSKVWILFDWFFNDIVWWYHNYAFWINYIYLVVANGIINLKINHIINNIDTISVLSSMLTRFKLVCRN